MKSFKLKNRALAAFLCLALVGGLVGNIFIKGSDEAEASGSLPGISELKNSNTEYNILEIVPDVSQAAFSWYVGESEPINEKKITAAYGADASTLQEKYEDARATLVSQNHLMTSTQNGEASSSILKNLGEVKVDASSLAVTGGFSSNEWFQRYVLDWNEGESQGQIKMTVLSPQNVTEAHIQLADMVIVSGGYYYPNSSVDPMVYSADVTVSTEVADAIISKSKQGLAVILDRRAYQGTGLESDRLFQEILGGDPTTVSSGVYGSVFYFSSVKSGEEVSNNVPLSDGTILGILGSTNQGYLVTSQFNTAFDSSVSGINGPFGDVLASIQKENVTRMAYQQSLLSEEITMARVIQYLISGSADTSSSVMKSTVQVLSIQPGDSSGIATYSSSIHDNFNVAEPSVSAKVGLPTDSTKEAEVDQVTWEELESWTGVSRDKINVVEMTVEEFIRQDDVVASTYDLVYIGNDISENIYGVYEEASQFNINGYTLADTGSQTYFAAIGDTMEKAGYSYNSLSNDISVEKYNELIDYVMAGRPVVVAPYLSAGLNYNTISAKPAVTSIDPESNLYKLLTVISDQTCVMRQDVLLAGADGVEGNSDDGAMLETLVSLVHIPMQTIEFATLSASMPEVYSEDAVFSYSGSTQSNLEYIFKITNPTVLDSVNYKVAVTLDLDGDGNYEVICNNFDSFKVTSLVTDTDGSLMLDSSMNPQTETQVKENELVADKYYQVSFDLPDSVTGIVPWKLDVTTVGSTAITVSTMSLTYSAVSEPVDISVLQIYAESSTDMTKSDNVLTTMFGSAVSSQVNFTLHSLSLADFDTIAQSETNNLAEYNSDIANFAKSISEDSTGQLALAVAMNSYDVVIFSSYSENAELSSEALEILKTHMASGVNILYSHSDMTKSDIVDETGDEYFWNTNAFKEYPYEISLEDHFVYSIGTSYYTNADVVSDSDMDCKILVNTINVMVPFSQNEDLENGSTGNNGNEGSDTQTPDQGLVDSVVDFYGTANGMQKITSVDYAIGTDAEVSDLALQGKFVGSLPMVVYFEVSLVDVSNCKFTFEVTSSESVTSITSFASSDGVKSYGISDSVPAMGRYVFEIPESYADKVTSITVKAQDAETSSTVAVGELTLNSIDFINLFEATVSDGKANEYQNLIPMG